MLINELSYNYYKNQVYKFLLYPEAWTIYIFSKDMKSLEILANIAIEIGGDLIFSKHRSEKHISLISQSGGQMMFLCKEPDNARGRKANCVIADDLYSLKDFREYFLYLTNLSMWELNSFNSEEIKGEFQKMFEKDKKTNLFYRDWKESLNENKKSD